MERRDCPAREFLFESVLAAPGRRSCRRLGAWPDEAWPEKPWGEVSRYGREYPEWKCGPAAMFRAAQTAQILKQPKARDLRGKPPGHDCHGETVEGSGDWEAANGRTRPGAAWHGIWSALIRRLPCLRSAALSKTASKSPGRGLMTLAGRTRNGRREHFRALRRHAFGAAITGETG